MKLYSIYLCFISFSIILSMSIYAVINDKISYVFMAEQYSIVFVYHIFFIYLYVNGHLGCFQVFANVNNAARNIEEHVSFQISVFIFLQIYTQVWNCLVIW